MISVPAKIAGQSKHAADWLDRRKEQGPSPVLARAKREGAASMGNPSQELKCILQSLTGSCTVEGTGKCMLVITVKTTKLNELNRRVGQ